MEVTQGSLQRMLPPHFDIPVGAQEEHAVAARLPGQVLHELETGFVRPVQVIEEQDNGSGDCHRLDKAAHRPEQPLLDVLTTHVAHSIGLWTTRKEPLKVRPPLRYLSTNAQRCSAMYCAQCLQEGVVRDGLLHVVAAAAGDKKSKRAGRDSHLLCEP